MKTSNYLIYWLICLIVGIPFAVFAGSWSYGGSTVTKPTLESGTNALRYSITGTATSVGPIRISDKCTEVFVRLDTGGSTTVVTPYVIQSGDAYTPGGVTFTTDNQYAFYSAAKKMDFDVTSTDGTVGNIFVECSDWVR